MCNTAATNGQNHTQIAAGDTIEFEWNPFDRTHHGPVLTYLANCNGPCETVDKNTLEFFKIDEAGLLGPLVPTGPGLQAFGYWAADKLDDADNTWNSTIPATIAPGNYVIRHERIALHNATGLDGAQNYPNCINLEITGSGTENPKGVLATALYDAHDPGIEIAIYGPIDNYIIPGPPLYTPGSAPATSSAAAFVEGDSTSAPSVPTTTSQPPVINMSSPTISAPTTTDQPTDTPTVSPLGSQPSTTPMSVPTTLVTQTVAASDSGTLSSPQTSADGPAATVGPSHSHSHHHKSSSTVVVPVTIVIEESGCGSSA